MTTITLHPIVQSYKDRITEAFEAEGYTVTSVDVEQDPDGEVDGTTFLDFGLEDREHDAIPAVRFCFYEPNFRNVEERRDLEEMMAEGRIDPEDVDMVEEEIFEAFGFEVDYGAHAMDEERGIMTRDPEQMRQIGAILDKHFTPDVDFQDAS